MEGKFVAKTIYLRSRERRAAAPLYNAIFPPLLCLVLPAVLMARAACVRCHGIFQEAGATGGIPKIPPAGKK